MHAAGRLPGAGWPALLIGCCRRCLPPGAALCGRRGGPLPGEERAHCGHQQGGLAGWLGLATCRTWWRQRLPSAASPLARLRPRAERRDPAPHRPPARTVRQRARRGGARGRGGGRRHGPGGRAVDRVHQQGATRAGSAVGVGTLGPHAAALPCASHTAQRRQPGSKPQGGHAAAENFFSRHVSAGTATAATARGAHAAYLSSLLSRSVSGWFLESGLSVAGARPPACWRARRGTP